MRPSGCCSRHSDTRSLAIPLPTGRPFPSLQSFFPFCRTPISRIALAISKWSDCFLQFRLLTGIDRPESFATVSYTHLDVYKRQGFTTFPQPPPTPLSPSDFLPVRERNLRDFFEGQRPFPRHILSIYFFPYFEAGQISVYFHSPTAPSIRHILSIYFFPYFCLLL